MHFPKFADIRQFFAQEKKQMSVRMQESISGAYTVLRSFVQEVRTIFYRKSQYLVGIA